MSTRKRGAGQISCSCAAKKPSFGKPGGWSTRGEGGGKRLASVVRIGFYYYRHDGRWEHREDVAAYTAGKRAFVGRVLTSAERGCGSGRSRTLFEHYKPHKVGRIAGSRCLRGVFETADPRPQISELFGVLGHHARDHLELVDLLLEPPKRAEIPGSDRCPRGSS